MNGERGEVGSGEQIKTLLAFLDHLAAGHAWEKDAACHDMSDIFFPAAGQEKLALKAKGICQTCPVQRQCWEASEDELYGVWAGTTVEERRTLRRQRAEADQ